MGATPNTITFDIDATMSARLAELAEIDGRDPSEVLGLALGLLLDASPGARRAGYAIANSADTNERRWAASKLNRATLTAFEEILRRRHLPLADTDANTRLETEEEIEAEAVRACRP